MKYAVFSDIHGNYHALKAILDDLKKKNINNIIYLGDAVSLGPDSNLCLNELIKRNVTFILGNHEYYLIDDKYLDSDMTKIEIDHHTWIKSKISDDNLKIINNSNNKYELEINNKKFTFIHFFLSKKGIYPFEHLSIFKNDKYAKVMNSIDSDYIFYGHLHSGRYDVINGKHYYGVGSSGCIKTNKTFYYLIDTNKEINIEKIDVVYNRNAFINRMKHMNYPEKEHISKDFYGI